MKRWRGTVPEEVDGRAERLRANLDAPRDVLLRHLGVTARVTRSTDRSEIRSASVDLFHSDSVLQFVPPGDLAALLREARRFLNSSGRCFHAVDCYDSNTQHNRRIPRLAYLAWPEPSWKLVTSRYLNYQNRWRMPQFVRLFESSGFRVRTLDPVVHAEDVVYARHRFEGLVRFADMSPEDIATCHFLLTGGVATNGR